MTAAPTAWDHTPTPRHLLGVWAHPDDEAYLSAGFMARTIEAGGSVTVVTATRGEKGTGDPDRFGTDDFGRFRERELRASLAELGVTDLRVLGYRDGECDRADDDQAAARLSEIIAGIDPDAIITFGPDGITGHPDHRAACRWTTRAWRQVRGAELFYATMTDEFVADYAELHTLLGVFDEFGLGRPFSVPVAELAFAHRLTPAELDRKRRALGAHASQTVALAQVVSESVYRSWWSDEAFRSPTPADLSDLAGWSTPVGSDTPEEVAA